MTSPSNSNPFGGKKVTKGTAAKNSSAGGRGGKSVQQAGPKAGRSSQTSGSQTFSRGAAKKGSAPFKAMGKGTSKRGR
jgi:hypothetical protein